MTVSGQPKGGPGILWLSRDFRFQDNPAMLAALRQGPLLPVFVLDGQTRAQGATSRWRLQQALIAFDAELRRRSGHGLTLLEGEADHVLPELIRQTGAVEVHQSDWPAPQMRRVQDRVRAALKPLGATLVLHPGHLLAHPARVRTGAGGAYRVYTPFARALRALGPDLPVAAVGARISVRDMPAIPLDRLELAPDMARGAAVLAEHALPAGEAAALARLEDFLDHAADYATQRDRPDLYACSGLSEHLALGEISPRTVWAMASDRLRGDAGGIAKFLSELIWREFAWHLLIAFPQMAERAWRPEWDGFPWRGAGPDLTRWQRAETGMALVDAGLREMWVTGRMHNRVRMVVASYLTKHLLTDWRLGLAHFEDCLTDWDPASNAMNWQWVAGCGPDAAPFFRIFNPEKQAAQYDPQGTYRQHWLKGDGAQAYLRATPPRWNLPPDWRESGGLEAGRARALAAYGAFREG